MLPCPPGRLPQASPCSTPLPVIPYLEGPDPSCLGSGGSKAEVGMRTPQLSSNAQCLRLHWPRGGLSSKLPGLGGSHQKPEEPPALARASVGSNSWGASVPR